jgi:probable rRNA maturation factor
MKFNLEINNQEKAPLSQGYFKKVISETLKLSKIGFPQGMNISLAIVSENEIKRINRIYRKKNKVTDILSFSEYLGRKNRKIKKENIFCELVVCYSYIKKSAEINGVSIKKEMAYVISHGILHCLGLRHSKKMYNIQDIICEKN